jgi:hypothetical protein
LQSIFGARASFPKINIDSGHDCAKAVGLADGNEINLVVMYLEGRDARHRVTHGLLNLRKRMFPSQVEGCDERHGSPPDP